MREVIVHLRKSIEFVDPYELYEPENPALQRINEFSETVRMPDEKFFRKNLKKIVNIVYTHFKKQQRLKKKRGEEKERSSRYPLYSIKIVSA